ncbi:MAG: NADH-quinone oxidoreductase subunit NuoN, partial [Comamonadaceae bacterium]
LTLLTLAVVAVLTGLHAAEGKTVYGFGGMVVSDPMGNWLKCFASVALMVTLVYGRPYAGDRDMLRGGEMFTISMFALLGMFVMISGSNFLMIYLGLELLTLSSYALVALRRDNAVASEAAMKYFVLGAMASGFLLYGLSMLYGATGSLDINEVYKAIATRKVNHQVLVFGLVFIVAGLGFKVGAAPFHMWVPDVYQGAPTAVTLLIGAAPELAAFAIIIRLLVEALVPLAFDWQQMLAVLAIASLLVGNLAAIAQTNLKRMLAYSTIAQMGFMLLGLVAGVVGGNSYNAASAYSASMFYIVTYVLTTLASFGIILLLAREGFESEEIVDLAGLNQRSPLYAGVMAIAMFSLAGLPPLVGFYAKLAVLQALIASSQPLYIALAVFAVIMSLVGAFYYLRVVKVMYFDKPVTVSTVSAPRDVRVVLSLNGALILVLGILPGGLMTLCAKAIVATLAT